MTTENRITTSVVAYPSSRLGHVTRPISLRTSERKGGERPHHPVPLSRARPPNESSWSATTVFIATFEVRDPRIEDRNTTVPHNQRASFRTTNEPWVSTLDPRTGRTGGNRTPNPRFWRPVLCQLSYCPK